MGQVENIMWSVTVKYIALQMTFMMRCQSEGQAKKMAVQRFMQVNQCEAGAVLMCRKVAAVL